MCLWVVFLLLINQAQPIHTGDEGDGEATYNVLDEESDIETHSTETVWSEAPVPIEEPGEYDRESPLWVKNIITAKRGHLVVKNIRRSAARLSNVERVAGSE